MDRIARIRGSFRRFAREKPSSGHLPLETGFQRTYSPHALSGQPCKQSFEDVKLERPSSSESRCGKSIGPTAPVDTGSEAECTAEGEVQGVTGDGLIARLSILQAPAEALLPFKRSRELFPPFSVQVQVAKAASSSHSEQAPVIPDRVTVRAFAISQGELEQIKGGGALPARIRCEMLGATAAQPMATANASRDLLRARAFSTTATAGANAAQPLSEERGLIASSNSAAERVVGQDSCDGISHQKSVPKYLGLVGLRGTSISLRDSSSCGQSQAQNKGRKQGSSRRAAQMAPEVLSASGCGEFAQAHWRHHSFSRSHKGFKFDMPTNLNKVHVAFAAVIGSQQDVLLTVFTPPQVCISRGDQRIRATCALGFTTTAAKHLWLDANAHILHSNSECSKGAVETACGLPCISRSVYKVKHLRAGRRVWRRTKEARNTATSATGAAVGGVHKKSSPCAPQVPSGSHQKVAEATESDPAAVHSASPATQEVKEGYRPEVGTYAMTTGPAEVHSTSKHLQAATNGQVGNAAASKAAVVGPPSLFESPATGYEMSTSRDLLGGDCLVDEAAVVAFFNDLDGEPDSAYGEHYAGPCDPTATLAGSASTASGSITRCEKQRNVCKVPVAIPSHACEEHMMHEEHALPLLHHQEDSNAASYMIHNARSPCKWMGAAAALGSHTTPQGVADAGQLQSRCVIAVRSAAMHSQELDSFFAPDAIVNMNNECEAASPRRQQQSSTVDALKTLDDTDSCSKESCDAFAPHVLSESADGHLCNHLTRLVSDDTIEDATALRSEAPMVPPGRPHRYFFPEMPRTDTESKKTTPRRRVCTRSGTGVRDTLSGVHAAAAAAATASSLHFRTRGSAALHRRASAAAGESDEQEAVYTPSLKTSSSAARRGSTLQRPLGAHNLTAPLKLSQRSPGSVQECTSSDAAPSKCMSPPDPSSIPLRPDLTRSPSELGPSCTSLATDSPFFHHSWPQGENQPLYPSSCPSARENSSNSTPKRHRELGEPPELDTEGTAAIPSADALNETVQVLMRGSLKPAVASLPPLKMQRLAQEVFVALRTAFTEPCGSSRGPPETPAGPSHASCTPAGHGRASDGWNAASKLVCGSRSPEGHLPHISHTLKSTPAAPMYESVFSQAPHVPVGSLRMQHHIRKSWPVHDGPASIPAGVRLRTDASTHFGWQQPTGACGTYQSNVNETHPTDWNVPCTDGSGYGSRSHAAVCMRERHVASDVFGVQHMSAGECGLGVRRRRGGNSMHAAHVSAVDDWDFGEADLMDWI